MRNDRKGWYDETREFFFVFGCVFLFNFGHYTASDPFVRNCAKELLGDFLIKSNPRSHESSLKMGL